MDRERGATVVYCPVSENQTEIAQESWSAPMSVVDLLNQIRNEEIVLPAVPRDFVWPEGKVLRLLDSVMQGCPIGLACSGRRIWISSTASSMNLSVMAKFRFKENKRKNKRKLVLDGQQRLQSLYIALYGSYEGKSATSMC